MSPTIIARNADNWVDRGEPADRKIALVLAHLFDKHADADRLWLLDQAGTVLGMVAAGATDYHVAAYLRTVARALPGYETDPPCLRMAAVAAWHAGKAALVRDAAERVLASQVPADAPTPEPLGHWLASRLLDRDEMDAFEADAGDADPAG